MVVNKINGFSAPYRSQTFQKDDNAIVGRKGVLAMSGTLVSGVGMVTVPAFSFIQNGLIVEKTTSTSVVTPPTLTSPYLLTVSSPSSAQTDDLVFQFAKAPEDVSSNAVIIADYDGEWRLRPFVTIDALYRAIESLNRDRVGPISGLRTTFGGGIYTNSPGVLIDKNGDRQELTSPATFPLIPEDLDWSRVDRIVYRRPTDSESRPGIRKYLIGGTYAASPSSLYNTEVFANTAVRNVVKTAIASDNTAHVFTSTGYGNTFSISYAKYTSSRTALVVAPANLFSATTKDFDVVIDASNNLHVVYVDADQIKWRKYNASGTLVTGPATVSTGATPKANPKIAIDPANNKVFIVYENLVGPGNSQISFATITLSGATVTTQTFLTSSLTNIINPALAVTDDMRVYVAYEDLTTNRVFMRLFNDIGVAQALAIDVSASTSYTSPLVGNAKEPKVFVTDNKSVFVTFLQNKGTQYGLAVWNDGSAKMIDLIINTENFTHYDVVVDSFANEIHALVSRSNRIDYVKFSSAVIFSINITTAGAESLATQRDLRGSMFHVWANPYTGTYTTYETTRVISDIGPATVTGSLNNITLNNAQYLTNTSLFTQPPKAGDRVVIAGSVAGNDGTYFIETVETVSRNAVNDSYRISLVGVTFVSESPAISVNGTYAAPDGNNVRFIKTTSELSANAYRTDELDSDVLLSRIAMPGSIILNYQPQGLPGGTTDVFGISSTNVQIAWGSPTAGELTFSGGLKIINLVTNVEYDVDDGAYPMVDGQAIIAYVDGSTTTPQVVNISDIPWGNAIQVLGFVQNGEFHGQLLALADVTQLDDGEVIVIGEDLDQAIRTRLGITSETTFQPYDNTYIIAPADTYPEAISKLDAQTQAILDSEPEEEWVIVPPGGISIYNSTTITWNPDNNVVDIQVFAGRGSLTQDRTGGLSQDFRKNSSTQLEFAETIPEGMRIRIRLERTGAAVISSGNITVRNQGVSVATALSDIDFVGDVAVTFLSAGKVQVAINTAVTPFYVPKQHVNGEAFTILAGSVCAFADDGTVVLADANIHDLSDIAGIAMANINPGEAGDFYKLGNIPNILTSLGAVPGQDIYLGETPGSLSLTAPPLVTDNVVSLGRAEPGPGLSGACTDLFFNPRLIFAGS